MDRSSPSVDSCDAEIQTPPETTTTRPNPFEDDDASSRKRRRTSASASLSPSGREPSDADAESSNFHPTVDKHDTDTAIEEAISTPDQNAHHVHTPPAPDSPNSLDPSSQLTLSLRRMVDEDRSHPSRPRNNLPNAKMTGLALGERVAADEDRDMFAHSFDDSSSSDLEEVITPPESFPFRRAKDDFHESVIRLTKYLSTAERNLDVANLEMLSTWMDTTIKFFTESSRSIVILTLQSHRKFWLSFPAVMNALTAARTYGTNMDSIIAAIQRILSRYSLFTAALVHQDCQNLQSAPGSSVDSEDELTLLSIESLHIWYDLLYIEERESSTSGQTDSPWLWTRSEMSKTLFSPFLASQGSTTQWISMLAFELSRFATPPRFRLRDLTLVACVLNDCTAEEHRLREEQLPESTLLQDGVCVRQNREAWLALSAALFAIIEKNISFLSNDTTNRLFHALANMLSVICQTDSQSTKTQSDGVDDLLKTYRSKNVDATAEMMQKLAPWQWRLEVLTKIIQSGLMHLRVMAVNTLCTCLADAWAQEKSSVDGREFLRHLGRVVDTELMGYIAGPSSHPEIILASANLIVFLVLSEMGTESLLDRLWYSIESSQDPRVADAITRVTNNITSVLHYSHLVHLCEKFNHVELNDFSPLLRGLWDTLIGEMGSKAKLNNLPITVHPFLSILRVLRKIPTCDDGVNFAYLDLHMVAIQRIRDLLAYGLETDVRHELYRNCVSHLASKSETTLGSLWFLSTCMRPAISGELHYLTETHDVVRLVVEELEFVVTAATNPSTQVLAGQANQARRDLILQIIHFQPKSITEELGARLWEALVGSKALNATDRSAAWQTVSTAGNNSGFQNPFLQICFSKYLPQLAADWYCEGMLGFVKENIILLVNNGEDFNLDDEELVSHSGIEHLWRIILFAHDEEIAKSAMVLLASGVYLESKTIMACTLNRAQNIHLKLIRQCLKLLRETRDAVLLAPADDCVDDDSIVIVEPEREMLQKKREFLRTLGLLHYFFDLYRSNPRFAAADLRSLIPATAEELKGEPVALQYQAFSDDKQTEVRPLQIGQDNSLASLLAVLRDESGFRSYKAYYRGKQFVPTETEVRKSLQELDMCEGLILLHQDSIAPEMPSNVKPGSSPIEIEILSHFSEFWQYLTMDESIAIEAYTFLLRLPVDGQLKTQLSEENCKYEDYFVPDQPYRLLYAIFTLSESVKEAQSHKLPVDQSSEMAIADSPYTRKLINALRLLAQCLDDEMIAQPASGRVQVQITSALIVQFLRLLDDTASFRDAIPANDIPRPSAARVLCILGNTTCYQEEEFAHLSAKCISLIFKLSLLDEHFWLAVVENPLFPELMKRVCILSHNRQFRFFSVSAIEEAIIKEADRSEANGCIAPYFWKWGAQALTLIPELGEACHELMKLMCCLVVRMHEDYSKSMDLGSLVQQLVKYLTEHTCTEDINQIEPCDVVAGGLINLLHRCIHLDTSLSHSIPSAAIFVLIKKHLFPQEENATDGALPKIILNPDTRGKFYECIFTYLRNHQYMLQDVVQFLDEMVPFFADGAEPYIYDTPFLFEQEKALRSPAGYVGLQNLSNTCYLNSLITQLYMNPAFRNYLMSFHVDETNDSKALLCETQKLFGYLQGSINRAVEPAAFVGAIKTYEQGPIDIHSQMDVDEFYNLLFDRWEAQLPDAISRRTFRSIYGGQLVQQIKSKECGHISERLEPFSAIQCDIKGKSTLEESLHAYVGGEIMDGDNKYKCSSCDRHVDAVKRACLKDIPDNVIFHLKRFEFNLQTLQRSKIDDYFAFPDILDLQPYTVEHLSGETSTEEHDMFELVGILVHAGTAESGHYYSYVRERSSAQDVPPKWVEFNDDQVSNWNPASMEASTFGGPERRAVFEENNMCFDKSYSAYMLFYQRIPPSKPAAEAEVSAKLCKYPSTRANEALKEQIQSENLVLLRRHCLFDPNHAKFVQACVVECLRRNRPRRSESEGSEQSAEEIEPPKPYQLAIETALSCLDQIFSRNKDTSFAIAFCNTMADLSRMQPDCAWHVFNYFQTRPLVLRSLLLRNPDKHIRAATGHLFVTCLETLSRSFPQLFYPRSAPSASTGDDEDEDMDDAYADNDLLSQAVGLLDQLWKYFQYHIKAWDEYFATILQVARLGKRECLAILSAYYLEKCLTIITADRSMALEANFVKMLQNVYRRFGGQPPSYVAILALIEYLLDQLEPEISAETIVETADNRMAHPGDHFPWTSTEVAQLLMHPEQDDISLFMARLLEIDQAPAITKRILERIMGAGDLPTTKLLSLLQSTIQSDAATEPLDSYIRATAIVVDGCSLLGDAQRLLQHVCRQVPSFQNGEGAEFLRLIWAAIENNRPIEEERVHMRLSTLRTIPLWAPYLLQYQDTQVRAGAESLVDMALRLPVEEAIPEADSVALSAELALAIGTNCLQFLQSAHIKRRTNIEPEYATILLRVLSNCRLVVMENDDLEDAVKEAFSEQHQGTLEELDGLVAERVDDASDWEGSALTSEPMDDDADTEEALVLLESQGYK